MGDEKGIEYLNSLKGWDGKSPFNLDKMQRLVRSLDDPQDIPVTAHIAGTNGKGSVAVALASICAQAGSTVGLATSPHLFDLRERVVIDGNPIGWNTLNEAAWEVREASRRSHITPSFHEAITAVAFLCFKQLDRAVIEVGLGGRLDASNVLERPAVAVISSISLDHTAILGSTLAAIAREKAGIVKRGQTVLVGRVPEEARYEISKICDERNACCRELGKDFWWCRHAEDEGCFNLESTSGHSVTFRPALVGEHQIDNMALAIAAALELGCSPQECSRGVANCFWPGRLEHFKVAGQSYLIDCAHNIAGAKALAEFLSQGSYGRVSAVFNSLDDKDWQGMLKALLPFVSGWHIAPINNPRALLPVAPLEYLSSNGISVAAHGSVLDAIKQARRTSLGGTVVIAGSTYLVGEARRLLIGEAIAPLWKKGSIFG